jgi:ADP-L-glycero-D-manno-heptose 6-epimerase
MKTLLTGACGFIGSRLAKSLQELKKDGMILSDAPDHRSRACFHCLENIPFEDRSNLLVRLDGLKDVDCVCHLGACTDTGVSDEAYALKWNTDYTKALWKWCASRGIPFVYASSAATYGRGEAGYSDNHADVAKLQPLNLYGKSKQWFDLWALDQKTAPPHWAGLKFFNVYGWGEGHKGRMASPVWHGYREIRDTGKQTLFRSHRSDIADGEQKRDFVFVNDIVELLQFHMKSKAPNGLYNCGSGNARSFLDLSKALFAALGKEPKIEWMDTPEKYRNGYQYFTQADMSKTRSAGFQQPMTALEVGVSSYVAWLEKNGGNPG